MPLTTEQIWEQLADRLREFIRRRVATDDAASDLLQETFVRIHTGLPRLRDEERLLPWVYRVTRNVVTDHYRKSRHDRSARDPDDSPRPDDAESGEDNFNAEVSRWLPALIESLPDGYREAVRLAEIDGLTQREVGERLDLSFSGAKSRVQRGRELLRRKLLECCHFELDGRGNVLDYERHGSCGGCAGC